MVSILIPVYNRESIISETISSAMNQTYKNIEIIVCDNASTDGTWNILEEYAQKDSRIKIFRNEENLGPVMNWKRCLDNATGEYGKILWSDDMISETFIEHTLPLFDDDTAFVLSGVRLFFSDPKVAFKESAFQKKGVYSVDEYLKDVLIYDRKGFPVSPGCALFRLDDLKKSFLIEIPNNENLEFKTSGAGNDLLFSLLTAVRYKNIKTVGTIESFYRCHENSLTMFNLSKIVIYYAWAEYYFVRNYRRNLLKKFKARIFVFKLYKKGYDTLYSYIKVRPSFSCCLYLIFDTLKTKLPGKLKR